MNKEQIQFRALSIAEDIKEYKKTQRYKSFIKREGVYGAYQGELKAINIIREIEERKKKLKIKDNEEQETGANLFFDLSADGIY